MSSPWSPAVVGRYVALQVPGWILLLVVMLVARGLFGFPAWVVAAALGALLVKDAALYPMLWRSYVASDPDAHPRAGALANVERALDPTGFVRVRGELWRATLAEGEPHAAYGETVRVESRRGLTLVVRRAPGVDAAGRAQPTP